MIILFSGFALAKKWDLQEAPELSGNGRGYLLLISAAASVCSTCVLSVGSVMEKFDNITDIILMGILSGCILFASVMDMLSNKVYDFIWWLAAASELIIYIWHPVSVWGLVCLTLFFVIQEIFLVKLYGRADCHAFCICAVMESIFGMDITGFLMHMIFSFFLLSAAQYFAGNIDKKGNLKTPVPFVPYITMAFWINLLVFLHGK
ncbi:MAG: hypothetical protein LUG83_00305 [Lachnospiraceae bacterium]|nr:hypothetical protein [Lachnospiraceae bacterium]